jgi:hypothetical protein
VHAIDVSISVITVLGLWKSLASTFLYIDVSVWLPPETLFFFGHILSCFHPHEAPIVRHAPSSAVSSSIDLSDAFRALLEFDD